MWQKNLEEQEDDHAEGPRSPQLKQQELQAREIRVLRIEDWDLRNGFHFDFPLVPRMKISEDVIYMYRNGIGNWSTIYKYVTFTAEKK